jgi:ATP-dependent protease ClpP protease subunit
MPPWIDVPQAPGAPRVRARAARDAARPGFEIRNAASGDEVELLVYDEIDSWWGVSASDVITELAQVTAPNLRVRINSPGGSVFEGLAIANALRAHPSNVIVQVDGLAASIASVIAMAGDRLVMMPNSMIMVHEASGICFGNATDMQQMADVLSKISDNIAGAYAAKAGGTAEDWRGVMRAETWYLAEDAVTAGLADEVISAAPAGDDDPDMHARWDLTVYGYRGPEAPQRPKPGPPPAKAQQDEAEPSLVISIAEALSEDEVAALRELAKAHLDTAADADGQQPAAPQDAVPEPAAEQPDEWAAAFAHLTTPAPDPWADAFAHLIQTPASSATDA